LLYQPGTRWVYSVSMDIQGYIVEKIVGQSLPDFMQQRNFRAPPHEGHGLLRSQGKAEPVCHALLQETQEAN